MRPYLVQAKRRIAEQTALLQAMVECETPSGSRASIGRFNRLLKAAVGDIAKVRTVGGRAYGDHLLVEFELAGPAGKTLVKAPAKKGQVLALAHSDTVWPTGTLATMPFKSSKGRLWGPGVLDIKGGIALFVTAMRILHDLQVPVAKRVVLQINSDEEIGSPSSRQLTEAMAELSDVALVLEPGTGLEGHLKTARKGTGQATVTVQGVASHAGVDFERGANAVVEIAHQIATASRFTNSKRGVTVNAGRVAGGGALNVVPNYAEAQFDLRVRTPRDFEELAAKFRALKRVDERCELKVDCRLNRPPMMRTPEIAKLFEVARSLAQTIGLELEESSTGGASDGNFTAALGLPTLDGLGAVGEGAHAAHESILMNRMADRTALLAGLVAKLGT